MKKSHYLKELLWQNVAKKGNKNKDVQRVQEWINLWKYIDPAWHLQIEIDGSFGPATETAVKQFQTFRKLPVTGEVDATTFSELSKTLRSAFSAVEIKPEFTLRDYIIQYANKHLMNSPREIVENAGPWVRSYMDGNEGKQWAWCAGGATTILDQAYSTLDKKFTEHVPQTYSCDIIGNNALQKNMLLRNKDLRKDASKVKPGDLFLVVKSASDWIHVGLVEQINTNGTFVTWEANTNDGGSREGVAVCRRVRNYATQNIDVVLLPI